MKKKLSFALIFIFLFACCFNLNFFKANNFSTYATHDSFAFFQEQFEQLIADDSFETVFVEENESYESFVKKVKPDVGIVSPYGMYSTRQMPTINEENINEICDEFDLVCEEVENGYEVYSEYETKRIIVTGKVTNSFGAKKVLTYKDYNILSYATEEDTKYAYENLSQDDSLIVVLNGRIALCDSAETQTISYDYSQHRNQWGTDAIDYGYYNEYLKNHNSKEEVVVAVIDTGIRATHSYFKNRILTDSNGNQVGYSHSSCGNFYNDGDGHGTHVAGIVCDMTPQNVKILPMKVFSDTGSSQLDYVTTALAALSSDLYSNYNIVAANLSLGNANTLTNSQLTSWTETFTARFNDIRAKRILPVVAAGNSAKDVSRFVPAVCENVVTVSALTGPNTMVYNSSTKKYDLKIAASQDYSGSYSFDDTYSNYGSAIDIAAPGTGIRSAYNTSNTSEIWMAGTSQAAPHVAAAVALFCLDDMRPNPTLDDLERRLYASAIPMSDIFKYGHGLLNLKNYNGNISHTVANTIVTYDGQFHNINVSVSGVSNPTIYYGFSVSECNITNISFNTKFKNFTNGAMNVYYKITAQNHVDTFGVGQLTINKAPITITTSPQSSVYGDLKLDQSKYTNSGTVFNDDDLGIELFTNANLNSSVGSEYFIDASITNDNYSLTVNKGIFTITQRPIELKLNTQKFEYGEKIILDTSELSYQITSEYGVVDGDDLNLQLTTNATNESSVDGSYFIKFVSANSNYNVDATDGSLRITQRNIQITLNKSSIYGDPVSFENINYRDYITSGSVISGDNLEVEFFTTASKTSRVAQYPITCSVENLNYSVSMVNSLWTISQRVVTVKPKQQESVYGESVVLSDDKCDFENVSNNDVITVTLKTEVNSTCKCGTYNNVIIATVVNSEVTNNYSFNYLNGTLVITPRPITLQANNQKSVYGDSVQLNSSEWMLSSGSIVNEDEIIVSISTQATYEKVARDYDINIEATGKDIGNYYITYKKGTFTIQKREIKIKLKDQDSLYGEKIELKLWFEVVSEKGIISGDDLNLKLKTNATPTSDIKGNYFITVDSYNNDNYLLEWEDGKYFIKEHEVGDLIITIGNQEFVYGEEIVLDQENFSTNIDVDKSLLGVILFTKTKKFDPVGNYEIDLTYTATNYDIIVVKGQLTIKQKELNITIEDQEFDYGEVFIDQAKHSLHDYNDVGIVLKSQANNLSLANTNYPIGFDWANKNYNVTLINSATLFIKPRNITIKSIQSFAYGSNVILNNKDYQVVLGSIVNEDNLGIDFSTLANKQSLVNDYEIEFTFANKNYNVKLSSESKVVIKQRKIEIEVEQHKYYGDIINLNPGVYKIISGSIVNNDDLNLRLSTPANANSLVGQYDIIVDECNSNYNVTLNKGVLFIDKRIVKIETIQSGEYGNYFSLNNSYKIIEGSLAFETDELNIKFSTEATMIDPVGEYAVNMSFNNPNYDVVLSSTSHFKILPRKLIIKLGNQSSIYGEDIFINQNNYQINSGSIMVGDEITISLSTNAKKFDNAGKYQIIGSINNSNYVADFENGEYIISKRPITIKLNNQKTARGLSFEINQNAYDIVEGTIVGDDELNIKIYSNAKMFSMIGNYKLQAESNNTNYDIKFENANLFLNISFVDITYIVVIVIAVILIIIKINKRKNAKKENQKLFDKWIKW